MLKDVIDSVHSISRQAADINNTVIEQNAITRGVILDALRHLKTDPNTSGNRGDITQLVEVPSVDVIRDDLAHLHFIGMSDRHQQISKAFEEMFGWAYRDSTSEY